MHAMDRSAHHNPRGAFRMLPIAPSQAASHEIIPLFIAALIREFAVEHINQGEEFHQMSISMEKLRRGAEFRTRPTVQSASTNQNIFPMNHK
jgi:hypothetical protein